MTISVETPRLVLRIPGPEHAARVLLHHEENREHLAPWEPQHAYDWLTLPYWQERLARSLREHAEGTSVRFFSFAKSDDRIVGVCNFTRFVREPLLSCLVGYHVDRREQGNGFATEALRGACEYVMSTLGFTRVEATYDAANERSGRVLRKAGFVVEGYAKGYLLTGGEWRDHVLTALVRRNTAST